MNVNGSILSDIIMHNKYARWNENLLRRETYSECVDRNKLMHLEKFPELKDEIEAAYTFVYDKVVLPSMRSMQFAGKPIKIAPNRMFNCFAKETKFVTSKGTKSFEEFSDGDHVEVVTHTGTFKQAVVRSYGEQELFETILIRGRNSQTVYATKDHRWIKYDGEQTTRLQKKDVLYPTPKLELFNYATSEPLEKLYWCYGYAYGNGTIIENETSQHYIVNLHSVNSKKYASRFQEMGFETSNLKSHNDFLACIGNYHKLISNIDANSKDLIKAFFTGYLNSSGIRNTDFNNNDSVSKYKQISTTDLEHAQFIEKCAEISGYFILSKKKIIKNKIITYRYTLTNNIGSSISTAYSVKNIKKTDRKEEVWCLEVEEDHSFILSGGIVTGNCVFAPVDDYRIFGEVMFLLLGGSGVGYSVQNHHIDNLPEIRKPIKTRRYLVGDSIEGWAESVKLLIKSYFLNSSKPDFDFSDIRSKGARLITSGGKAPGPAPLQKCLFLIEQLLNSKTDGDKLKPIDAHDIMCYIADAVLAGGIRRSAMIALFSIDDIEMLTCKSGNWFEKHPHRGRANNSAVVLRSRVTKESFGKLFEFMKENKTGEPAIFLTNDKDMGLNPCGEASLRAFSGCNLTEINASLINSQEELNAAAKAASFIGTLQASYTRFHYLRPIWERGFKKDSLIGVGITGLANENFLKLDLTNAAKIVVNENKKISETIGIKQAARTTLVKPSGTTALLLGTSSGIHDWYAKYYIRRIKLLKNEEIYHYLARELPELMEDDWEKPHIQAILSIPMKAPEGAILREDTTPIALLERVKDVYKRWIFPGHITGSNTHAISCTVNVKDNEWDEVENWMWTNKDSYNCISVFPHFGGSYKQLPFEEITEECYYKMSTNIHRIDLTKILEMADDTNLTGEAACAGGACELTF